MKWTRSLAVWHQLHPSQWLMLATILTIFALLMLASHAKAQMAAHYPTPHSYAQTISHCGYLQTRPVIFARQTRPYRNQRNTRIIQRKLTQLGYSLGRPGIDSKFGPRTRRAVTHFQDDHNLARDGVVGPNTAKRLAYASHPFAYVRQCSRPAQPSRLF